MPGIENKPKRSNRTRIKAIAYLRTSSASNVGQDKDSERRRRVAIASFAKSAGYDICPDNWFYDPAVSGADEIEKRSGFVALLNRVESNGVRVVIVEDASRFSRKLMTQESGILSLVKRGVRVLTASGDDLTDAEDEMRVALKPRRKQRSPRRDCRGCESFRPQAHDGESGINLGVRVMTASGDDLTDAEDEMRVALRQIMGAFAELEKKRLVKKLRGAPVSARRLRASKSRSMVAANAEGVSR